MGLDNIQNYVIGIIIFTIIIGGGAFVLNDFLTSDTAIDPNGAISQFNSSLYKSSEVTTAVDSQGDSLDVDEGGDNWLNVLLGSTFGGLKTIGATLGFMDSVSNEAGNMLGIPLFIIGLLALIATVIIIFAIYTVITRT